MSELADRPLRIKEETILLHWWRLLRWFANLRLVPRWREENTRLMLRALRRYYYDGLTRPGKILFICCLLTFLFSYRINSNLYLLTAALGMSLLLWGACLGWLYRPNVSIRRNAPATGTAGIELTSQITVRNEGNLSLYNFILREQVVPYGKWPREWFRPHHMKLAPKQECAIPVSFQPNRRGKYELSGVAVESYFPFFLTRFIQRLEARNEIYVLPPPLPVAIPSLRQVAETATKRLKLGTDNTRKGPSLEYSHSRQYQTGDSLRRLDHRASSRLAKPMSKIFEGSEEIRRDQVYLVVDLSLQEFLRWQRRPVDASPLDDRLALTVEIGLSAQNEGFSLIALATGHQWHQLNTAQQFDQLIATCEPTKTREQAIHASDRRLPETTPNEDGLHILVLGRWNSEASDLVERWQKQGILTLVFMLPESKDDIGTLPVGAQFIEIQPPEKETKRKGLQF